MYSDYAYSDVYAQMRIAELLREADNERLANQVAGPGRPVRARIASWLVAVAQWIEGSPQGSIVRAEA